MKHNIALGYNEAMAIINFYEATNSNTNDWDQDKLRRIKNIFKPARINKETNND